MEFKIKRFNELTTDELYRILRARSEVFVVEQACIYQECDNKDYNAYHLYLEEVDEVIAYLRILEKGISYDEISIGRVLVKDTHRNKGLSRATMLKAISFVEEQLKSTEIRISGQVYLREFYKSLGFKEVSAEYLEDDIPHVEMLYKK
ncbi:MAG: GNAT family N-acetyltransferase [Clostridium sp.]|uniref:GNAT family N-acetyltransferase n=1 Tax=Clostridium sp. TaxID=1506 RepID=UPI003070B87C